jgi:hypothetical protein
MSVLRIAAIALVLAVGLDHFMVDGKYTSAFVRTASSILHHFTQ